EVLRRAPAHVVGWHQLGEAREQAGNREGAIEAFRRALSIRGDFLDARVGLARVYGGQGRYEEALAELNLAVREAPQHLLARVNRGITLLALNRFDEGAAELRQAAQDNPTVPLPLVRLAEALSARKSHGEAAEAYATASARDPGNAALAHREGLERSRAGQLPAAETAFRQSLIRSPEFFTAHVDLGVLLAQQARFTEAIPEFESALRLQPTNAVARQYLDLARQKLQQAGGQ
ncbi:MAG: hypothetical protein RIS76_234, partial [Verrucomicrobiota bacterium]